MNSTVSKARTQFWNKLPTFLSPSLCPLYVINIDLFKESQMKSPRGLGRMYSRMGELIFLASEEKDITGFTRDLLPP